MIISYPTGRIQIELASREQEADMNKTSKEHAALVSRISLALDEAKRELLELARKSDDQPALINAISGRDLTLIALEETVVDDDDLIPALLKAIADGRDWQMALPERDRQELSFAIEYARNYAHGTAGHNRLMLIDKLNHIIEALLYTISRLERGYNLESGGRDD